MFYYIQQILTDYQFLLLTNSLNIISYLSPRTMLSSYSTNNKKDLFGNSASMTGGRKKIKNYSYNPSDRIGKGFSSVVYKGTNDSSNQIVAIKAIDMKGVKDAISREMLDCQIEALTTLKHDSVLRCFQVVREPLYCYIVTEFCNQGDLSVLLKKKKKVSEEETMKILKNIVSGFIEIGQKGFLHRDLKLANIFMHDNVAKIADFGFAKKNRFSSEKERYNVGSPLYMSPEALKKNIYSLKNDIWSIGIMAYELLYGETPWQCKTEKELIDKMTRIPIRFRETLKISENMKDFIRKCLEVDEKKRMSLDELKVWINSEGASFTAVSQTHPLGLRQQNLPPRLNLSHKPTSNIDKLGSVAGNNDVSGRISSRSYRHGGGTNKQNISRPSGLGGSIPKTMIEKNNAILVNEINTFRLMYKLMQKVKRTFSSQSYIVKILGNEVVKRVKILKKCCENREEDYGLVMVGKYFDEKQNSSIKKYRSVVSEYFKKYTSEIQTQNISNEPTLIEQLKNFLNQKAGKLATEDQLLIGYWAVELIDVNRQTSKQKLDLIIEPRIKLNGSYIDQRIKQIRG